MTKLLTFGESMAALRGAGPLRLGGTLHLSVAGTESNVAIGLARLGHAVEWVGRVGGDEFGRLVLRTLRAEEVDVAGAVVDDRAPTGVLFFEQRIAEVTRVTYYRSGSAGSLISSGDVVRRFTPDITHLHVTGVTAALGANGAQAVAAGVTAAHERGVRVSLDVNFRSRLWTRAAARSALLPLLPMVDVLFASEDELGIVAPEPEPEPDADAGAAGHRLPDAGAAAGRLVDAGVPVVVVKRAAAGATVHSPAGEIGAPARAVPVVDVVGAGDAFVAGFLSGRLDGLDVASCLERGVVLGAFAVSRAGDWEGLPTRAELPLLDAAPGTTLR